jgi:hypothetical protein
MSAHPHTISGPPSDVMPLPPDPAPIFELNQARRAKVTRELEALRSGKHLTIPKSQESNLHVIVTTIVSSDTFPSSPFCSIP